MCTVTRGTPYNHHSLGFELRPIDPVVNSVGSNPADETSLAALLSRVVEGCHSPFEGCGFNPLKSISDKGDKGQKAHKTAFTFHVMWRVVHL